MSDLIGLRAGEEAGEGATAGRQRGRERGPAVSQDGLQVAREGSSQGQNTEARCVFLLKIWCYF